MPTPLLSAEIWLMILEEVVLGDPQHASNMSFSLLHVCRMWKNLVEPLLYRRLLFWSSHQIQLFVTRIYALKREGHFPTRRTTTLCLTSKALGLESSNLVLMLRGFPKLQHLDSALKLSWKELEILADSCAQHLRVLDICVDDSDGTGLAFMILPRFSHLVHMHLCITDDPDPDKRSPLHEIATFILPELKYLELRMAKRERGNYARYLTFLGLCRYPALKHLRLSHLFQHEVLIMGEFFFRHGPQLIRFDVEEFSTGQFPMNLLPRLEHLGLLQAIHDRTFDAWDLQYIVPPSVRILHFVECPVFRTCKLFKWKIPVSAGILKARGIELNLPLHREVRRQPAVKRS